MMTTMQGRVACVTGAAVGMGQATAMLFAEKGAAVVVADINVEAGQNTAQKIRDAGGIADFVRVDVADEAAVEAMVAFAAERFGRLDYAVNNAATLADMLPIAEADLRDFDRVIAINLRSVMACLKHEIRQMLTQDTGGSIVNIASISGLRPQPGNPGYMASKSGVLALTRSASLDYAPKGIRVNAVAPGVIRTPMAEDGFEKMGVSIDEVAPMFSLLGRLGEPREVAEASLWLCSEAASYVTGQTLAVDAGYSTR